MKRFFLLLFLKIISLVIGFFFHLLYKIWNFFKTSKQRGIITLLVLSAHFSLVIYFFLHKESFTTQRRPHPIAVRLIQEERPRMQMPVSTAKATPRQTAPRAEKKTATIKKESPPTAKKVSASSQKKQILKSIEKTLQKTEEKQPAALHMPATAPPPTYQQLLVEFLSEELSLPEAGEIKVKLLISFDGKIKNCEILFTSSRENELYLQQMLKQIEFPKMENAFISKEELEFLITFKGE